MNQVIRETFPHHALLGEEGGASGDVNSDFLWCIDPLDGAPWGADCMAQQLLRLCWRPAIGADSDVLCQCVPAVFMPQSTAMNRSPCASTGTTNFAHGYPSFATSIGEAPAACPCCFACSSGACTVTSCKIGAAMLPS